MSRQSRSHIDDPAAFGRRLREARARAGLRLADVEFQGCSIGYLSHLEHGKRVPSLQVVRELAARLDVDESWLAIGENVAGADAGGELPMLVEAEAALRFSELETAGDLYRRAVVEARSSAERARARAGVGVVLFERGDPRAGLAELEAALELDPALRADPGFAEALGRAYARVGEMEMALAVFRERFDAAGEAGDGIERARFAVLLGNALIDSASLAEAAQVLSTVLADAAVVREPLVMARVYWSQSRLHAMREDSSSAGRYARKALTILEATDYLQQRSRAHHLLAYIEVGAGRAEEALELIERGRELGACAASSFDRAKFDIEEARVRARLGELDRAADLAMRASQELAHHHPNDVGRCFAEVASVCDRAGDQARARELYELALEYLERQSPSPVLAETLVAYAELAERVGDRDGAFDAYKRAATTRAELDATGITGATLAGRPVV